MNYMTALIYEKFLRACRELKIKPTDARWQKYLRDWKQLAKEKIRS